MPTSEKTHDRIGEKRNPLLRSVPPLLLDEYLAIEIADQLLLSPHTEQDYTP